MTTIIRVKRHRGEDPVEALVLSCKRKKTEDLLDGDAEPFQQILNFSGTVEEKDDNIATSTVQSYAKDSNHSKADKTHTPEFRLKNRKEWKTRTDDNRFTLLSCLRSLKSSEGDKPEDLGKNVTIVDVSTENKEKSSELDVSDGSYVYDLYSTHLESDSDFNDLYMENLLSVQPLELNLEYRNGEDCYEEIDPDEDDSNDENNWRNDYPDTDPEMEGSDEETDILTKQMKGFMINDQDDDGYELSGDSGEEEYMNYEDVESYHFYEAEDLAGRKYARYKANAMRHIMDADKEEDEDDSDDDYHDCEVLSYHENSE